MANVDSDHRLLDSVWFAFIASTTIGLGDFVPPAREWHVVLGHFFFLVVGVTLVGLLISAAVRSYIGLQQNIEERILEAADLDDSDSESETEHSDGSVAKGGSDDGAKGGSDDDGFAEHDAGVLKEQAAGSEFIPAVTKVLV
jgi:hypothetical protein